MEAALQISFYVLGVVFVLGMLMVAVLVKDVFFHGRFSTILSSVKRVPTTALDAARETLKALQLAHTAAHGERREALAYEIKHLELRIAALEDKTYSDQSDYYAAAKARERTWREWRALHDQVSKEPWRERRKARNRLDDMREEYRKLDREVDEEYQRAVARDILTLEELRSQGILDPDVLRPAQHPAAGTPAPAGAADAGEAPQPAAPAPQASGAGTGRSGRWMTPLTPYPPAQGGILGQEDLARHDVLKSGRTYVDPTLSMAGLPGGALNGVDFSHSSLAEVEMIGLQHFVNCSFMATDLRRIELRRAEAPHIFQECDLRGASLAQAHLAGVVFRRCNLSATHWRNARLDRVKFESCALDNVRWEGVDLSRTVMSDDMLARSDFAFAGKPPLNLKPGVDSPPELAGAGLGAAPAAGPAPAPGATPAPGAAPAPGSAPTGAPAAAPPTSQPAPAAPQPTRAPASLPAAAAPTDAEPAVPAGDTEPSQDR